MSRRAPSGVGPLYRAPPAGPGGGYRPDGGRDDDTSQLPAVGRRPSDYSDAAAPWPGSERAHGPAERRPDDAPAVVYRPGNYRSGGSPAAPLLPDEEWWPEARGRALPRAALLLLALLAIVSGAVALYGMFLDRTPMQIPLTVSGLAVFGVALALLAILLARATARLGRRGQGGRALLTALVGGTCAMVAAGSLAAAFILGMVAASA